MKTKRRIFLCCLMTLLMAFVMAVPMSASAAVSETDVVKIGDTGYATLGDAVAAVPTDGTQTTITFLKDATGGGVQVQAGQNIIFDFDTHTYTVGAPTVGSTGTETSGFQLLKGSNVTMQNGALKGSDYQNLRIMIQNYCDLNIVDMDLDASNAPQCDYVMSNNHGDVSITGETNITAAEGKNAFDVYYWPAGGYGDGVSVTVDTTGTISGNIEYGSDGTDKGKESVADNAKLVINDGFIDGNLSTSGLSANNDTGIEVSGGAFTGDSLAKYVTAEDVVKISADGGNTITVLGEENINDVLDEIENPENVTVTIEKLADDTVLNLPVGITVENGTGDIIEIDGEELSPGATTTVKDNDPTEEPTTPTNPTNPANPTTNQQGTAATQSDTSPQTGDDFNMGLAFAIMALAGLAAVGTVVVRRITN